MPTPRQQEDNNQSEPSDIKDQVVKPKGVFLHLVGTLMMVIIFASLAAAIGVFYIDKGLKQDRQFGDNVYKISKGDTLTKFINQLEDTGAVREPYSMQLYARYKGLSGKLHTGYYQFDDGMSLTKVLDAITTGKHQLMHTFKFVQGSTFKQLRKALSEDESLTQTLADKSDLEVLQLFDTQGQYSHPEGLFFPETYAFSPGETDQAILQRAFLSTQAVLTELWAQRSENINISSPYEALIMASIIEKETGLASERPLISGVFDNRLVKGMRLQTDPTVIYGIGDQYDGNITRAHLKTDTPYNTYTRYGLTPTPISMPGRAAIKAALNPAKTDAIYFVAKGDGSHGHNFSKTLVEHNRAVKQYLKAIKKRG